jgi:hypothetical protein
MAIKGDIKSPFKKDLLDQINEGSDENNNTQTAETLRPENKKNDIVIEKAIKDELSQTITQDIQPKKEIVVINGKKMELVYRKIREKNRKIWKLKIPEKAKYTKYPLMIRDEYLSIIELLKQEYTCDTYVVLDHLLTLAFENKETDLKLDSIKKAFKKIIG